MLFVTLAGSRTATFTIVAIATAIVAALQSSFCVASCTFLVSELRLDGSAGQLQAVQAAAPHVP